MRVLNQAQSADLKLSELIKKIPAESLYPPSLTNFFGFVIKYGLFATFFTLALLSENWLAIAASTLVAGLLMFSLGTVGHDCGHGAYIRPRWLNNLIGQMCIVTHGMPYEGWRNSHNVHHSNTNRLTQDPDRLWIYKSEYLALSPFMRYWWGMFQTRLFWLSAAAHYFRSILPWAFIIESKTTDKKIIASARRDIAILLTSWLVFHSSMFALGFGFKSIFLHVIMVLIGFAGLSVYVRTQHFLLDTGPDLHVKPWDNSRTVLQHPILDFFVTNLNYHVEHHILQTIPHYNLKKLRPMVKDTIERSGHTYYEFDLWPFMQMAFSRPFYLVEDGTDREILASEVDREIRSKKL